MSSKDIQFELCGDQKEVAVIRLTRLAKRNALNDALILALRDIFEKLPSSVRAAVIDGEGEHFCAGLDLSELQDRDAGQGLHHSRMWHAALECVQYGPVPVIAALHGAVVGGGLELASACHIRVADESECALEQSIVDSNISVVLETYISDDHITFSEKIFRALQLPRPWLLYCSPQSVKYLRCHGFDVLDDYVDHSYDNEISHSHRLMSIIDQLEQFVERHYDHNDYARFEQAAEHNRNLLLKFAQAWPAKFDHVLKEIAKYD